MEVPDYGFVSEKMCTRVHQNERCSNEIEMVYRKFTIEVFKQILSHWMIFSLITLSRHYSRDRWPSMVIKSLGQLSREAIYQK